MIKKEISPTPQYELLWITGFPLFCTEEEGEGGGGEGGKRVLKSVHHPFTSPIPEHKKLMYSTSEDELTKVREKRLLSRMLLATVQVYL